MYVSICHSRVFTHFGFISNQLFNTKRLDTHHLLLFRLQVKLQQTNKKGKWISHRHDVSPLWMESLSIYVENQIKENYQSWSWREADEAESRDGKQFVHSVLQNVLPSSSSCERISSENFLRPRVNCVFVTMKRAFIFFSQFIFNPLRVSPCTIVPGRVSWR